MKNIGILFDVSSSMKEKFDNLNNLESINRKSDELINILKNIAKNVQANIFTILFGLSKSPYTADFIKLLKIANKHFKPLTSNKFSMKKIFWNSIYDGLDKERGFITTPITNYLKGKVIRKTSLSTFRQKFMNLITKNNTRYCNIENYIFEKSEEFDYELLAEFYCNLIEEDPLLVDQIYNSLPKEVTNEEEYIKLVNKGNSASDLIDNLGMGSSLLGIGAAVINLELWPIFLGVGIGAALTYKGNQIKEKIAEEQIKEYTRSTIFKAFNLSMEKIVNKILEENAYSFQDNYNLINGKDLLDLIETLENKILKPEGQPLNIMNLFDKYLYGNTPLYPCYNHIFKIFQKQNNSNNFLIIVSDGIFNDVNLEKTKNDIIKYSNKLNITTICIYLNSANKFKTIKKFYNKIESDFDEGAKFLFNISSKLNYHNCIIKYFMKKDWDIPLNGVCNLFIRIDNSKNLNELIKMINESLDFNDPIEEFNNIIAGILLNKIIGVNYIGQFKAEDQGNMGWCWAYSISAAIYLASSRVIGRKIESFQTILNKILTLENAKKTDPYEKQGRNLFITVKKHIQKFRLRYSKINAKEARRVVLEGRPCLSGFYLDQYKWANFSNFFKYNKKGILTKEILNRPIRYKIDEKEAGGHAVVLTSIEENCLCFLNSWGPDFSVEGYFRIKDESVLDDLEFIDIFWYENDLSNEEKDFYNKYHLSFIQKTSKYLSLPNISLENLKFKKERCYKCQNLSFFKYYKIILYQEHYLNDETDTREPKVICPNCNNQLEMKNLSEELIAYLYINYIVN